MTDCRKPPKDYTKSLNIRQSPTMFDKYPKYLKRVVTSNMFTHFTKYLILKNHTY